MSNPPFGSAAADTEALWQVQANSKHSVKKYGTNRISNTKYTWYTFLPFNLIEQFGRPMNVYFLIIATWQLWSYVTPVNPASTWGPLIVIFMLTAIKEGVDDLQRYYRDVEANTTQFTVIRNGIPQRVDSEAIGVGEIVKLTNEELVPADMVR